MSQEHEALKLLQSLWDDTGLRQLMRPDQQRRIEQVINLAAAPVQAQEPVAWRYQPKDGLAYPAYTERYAQALAYDAAPVPLYRTPVPDGWRGADCEVFDTEKQEWRACKFIALSFSTVLMEPIVQIPGRMPWFATWGSVRGLPKDAVIASYSAVPPSEPKEVFLHTGGILYEKLTELKAKVGDTGWWNAVHYRSLEDGKEYVTDSDRWHRQFKKKEGE